MRTKKLNVNNKQKKETKNNMKLTYFCDPYTTYAGRQSKLLNNRVTNEQFASEIQELMDKFESWINTKTEFTTTTKEELDKLCTTKRKKIKVRVNKIKTPNHFNIEYLQLAFRYLPEGKLTIYFINPKDKRYLPKLTRVLLIKGPKKFCLMIIGRKD